MFVYTQKRGFVSRVSCYNFASLSHTQDVILFSLGLLHVCVVNTQQPFDVNVTNWECFQKWMMLTLSHLKLLIAKLCTTCIIATIIGRNYLHLELEKRKCSFFLFTCILNLIFMLSTWKSLRSSYPLNVGQYAQNSTDNFSFAKFKVSTEKIQLSLPLTCKIIQTHTCEVFFLPMVSKHFDFVFLQKEARNRLQSINAQKCVRSLTHWTPCLKRGKISLFLC